MGSVRRVFVEKKPDYAVAAKELRHEIRRYLGIMDVTGVRVLIRYDVENISDDTFEKACSRDHFLQYGTKSGEGLGKPRFQHKSVAYDQSVGGHPVCSPAGALYLADVAPYLGVQRVGWFHLLPA